MKYCTICDKCEIVYIIFLIQIYLTSNCKLCLKHTCLPTTCPRRGSEVLPSPEHSRFLRFWLSSFFIIYPICSPILFLLWSFELGLPTYNSTSPTCSPGLLPDPTGDAAGAPLRPGAPTSSSARFYFHPDVTDLGVEDAGGGSCFLPTGHGT